MADEESVEEKLAGKEMLERYQHAGLANRIFKDPSRGVYSLMAMKELYRGFGLDDDDPMMNRAFGEAYAGIRDSQVTNSSIFQAIKLYSEKYEIAHDNTKIEDFAEHFAGDAYDDIPDKVKGLIEKYKDKTLVELEEDIDNAKRSKNSEKYKEAMTVKNALGILENYFFETVLYRNLVKIGTQEGLEKLVEEHRN